MAAFIKHYTSEHTPAGGVGREPTVMQTVDIPAGTREEIALLIRLGIYTSRSELVRAAINRALLKHAGGVFP
jgi:hypothetical protein